MCYMYNIILFNTFFSECKAKCCGSECDPPPSPLILLYVGSSVGGTVALIIVILIVVFICRSRRVQRDDTYLDPTTDKEYFKTASKEKLDYNQSTNYYLSELSLAQEE